MWGFLKILFGTSTVKVEPYAEPSVGPRVPPPLQSVSAQIVAAPVIPTPPKEAPPGIPNTPTDKDLAWQAFARRSEKILAIKAYREQYGGDLSAAKNAVEAYVAEPPNPSVLSMSNRQIAQGDIVWQTFAQRGEKLSAIKSYREQYRIGLSDAIKAVEAYLARTSPIPDTNISSSNSATAATQTQEIRETRRANSKLDDAIKRGALIEAIKLYRQQTGASLPDAKNWVETQQRARGQR